MANEELKAEVAKLLEKDLKEYYEWIETGREGLPQGVINILARGVNDTNRKINEWGKK